MRKVFTDKLPTKIYNGRESIDWNISLKEDTNFIYDNIKGYFTILEYNKSINKIRIVCSIYNIEGWINPYDFTICKIKTYIQTIINVSKVIKYLKIAKKLGRTLTEKERIYYKLTQKSMDSGFKYLGYDNIIDFQNKNNLIYKSKLKYDYMDIYVNYKEFFDKYDRFPVNSDYKSDSSIISKFQVYKTLEDKEKTIDDLFKEVSKTNFNREEYEYNKTMKKFKEVCIKENKVVSINSLQEKIGHDMRWISNRNTSIKSYYDFYNSFGFKNECDLNKNEITDRIYKMQSILNRPLMYDDFRDSDSFDEVGIFSVKRIWGTMNKMKEELGLEIIQEDMVSKHIDDFNTLVEELQFICDSINKDDRNIITTKDINSINRLNINYQSFQKRCLENNTSVRNVIKDYGFELQKEGNGLVYSFSDGERTVSQFELNFSNKLREYGYLYDKNYFRDVRYKEFINDYNDMMNCDYVIHIGNKAIYIELAGMLGGSYETNYKNNKELKSKSKKLYAEKLKQKENMFIQNGLNYFILFPSDLKEDDLDFLFENKLNIQRKDLI